MAGSASNWFKPTSGPLKGQAFYLSKDQQKRFTYGDRGAARPESRGLADARRKGILDLLSDPGSSARLMLRDVGAGNTSLGDLLNATRPKGVALTAALVAHKAAGAGMYAREPALHQAPGEVSPSEYDTIKRKHRSTARTKDGDPVLAELYARQGFNAKPQVVTKAELDQAIADGEPELFRGVQSTYDVKASDMQAGFRDGDTHYAGFGIYGNGSYFAGAGKSASSDTARRTAAGYAGHSARGSGDIVRKGDGVMVRASLRKGAKTITSDDLQTRQLNEVMNLITQARTLGRAATRPIGARYKPLIQKLEQARDQYLTPTGKVPKAAKQKALYDAADARVQRLRKRYNAEDDRAYNASGAKALDDRAHQVPGDLGHYAVMLGYDAIHVASNDFYVVLNRGALRIQDSDPLDG